MLELTSPSAAAEVAQDRAMLAIARAGMAFLFLYSGFGKVTGFAAFSGYLSSLGIATPTIFTLAAITIELGVGLCLTLGYRARLAAWTLAAYAIAATFIGHPFWQGGPDADSNLLQALKNLAIVGGLLAVSVAQSATDPQRR